MHSSCLARAHPMVATRYARTIMAEQERYRSGQNLCHNTNNGSAKNITKNNRNTCSAVTTATDKCSASAVRHSSVMPPGIMPSIRLMRSTLPSWASNSAAPAATSIASRVKHSTRSRNAGALRKKARSK